MDRPTYLDPDDRTEYEAAKAELEQAERDMREPAPPTRGEAGRTEGESPLHFIY